MFISGVFTSLALQLEKATWKLEEATDADHQGKLRQCLGSRESCCLLEISRCLLSNVQHRTYMHSDTEDRHGRLAAVAAAVGREAQLHCHQPPLGTLI